MASYTPYRPDLAPPDRQHVGGQEREIEIAPGIPMRFCWCPPGEFLMGSPESEAGRYDNEGPQHPVLLTHGFWLAKHHVTQQQWQAVMGNNPSERGQGADFPVDSVSWDDCTAFCAKLGLHLPAEAQWEYACRAGAQMPLAIGAGDYLNSQMANFNGAFPYGTGANAFPWSVRSTTLPVASFPPNAWGLHDLHGQLWEWCNERLGKYGDVYATDPNGASNSRYFVLRGGGWHNEGRGTRAAFRYGFHSDPCIDFFGLRPSSTRPRPKAKGGAPRGMSKV